MTTAQKRILIVDDENRIVEAFSRRLRMSHYLVDTALSARAALQLCEERSYDLVILDLMMPVVNGVELLAKIRGKRPLIRSIIISGQTKDAITETELDQKLRTSVAADRYLDKPVSAKVLCEAVGQLLTGASADWNQIATEVAHSPKISLKTAKDTAKELKALKRTKK
jgi:DNA-binding response OmpR family regulator